MLPGALAFIVLLWLLRAVNAALSFALIPRLAPALPRKPGAPFVSIVVPARNEERDVEEATRSKCLQDDPAFEVVVVDDRSSDGTRRDPRGPRERVPRRPPRRRRRRAAARLARQAARARRGRARGSSDAAARLARLLGRGRGLRAGPRRPGHGARGTPPPRVPVASCRRSRRNPSGRGSWCRPSPSAAFCYFPGWLMNVPSARRFGGGGGVFNLIRRDLFERIGGHEALKASVVDDIQLGRNARLGGGRTGIAIAIDSVRVRMYHGFGEIVKGLEKNAFFAMLANLPLAVLILGWFFLEGELAYVVLLGGALEWAARHIGGPAAPPLLRPPRELQRDTHPIHFQRDLSFSLHRRSDDPRPRRRRPPPPPGARLDSAAPTLGGGPHVDLRPLDVDQRSSPPQRMERPRAGRADPPDLSVSARCAPSGYSSATFENRRSSWSDSPV